MAAEGPLMVVLRDTGAVQDELPVLAPHPDAAAVEEAMQSGLSRDA